LCIGTLVFFVFPIFSWQPVPVDLAHQVVAFVFSLQLHQVAYSLPQFSAVACFLFPLIPFHTIYKHLILSLNL